MKTRFVVINLVKYLLFFLILLIVVVMSKGKSTIFIILSFLLILLIILIDTFNTRKNNDITNNYKLKNEIKELNLEAATQSDSMDFIYTEGEIKDKGLKEFIEKISHIRKELNLKSHELEALKEVSQIITSTFDVKTIIDYTYRIINRFTGCDRYLISFVDKDRETLIYKYEFGEVMLNEIGNEVQVNSFVYECYKNKKSVKKVNTFIRTRNIYGDKIVIPLNASGEVVGVLFIESGIPNAFSEVNMEFLESLSVYAAISIKNAELFNSIYEQKQEIEALYEETAAVNEELSDYIDQLNKTEEELKVKNVELTAFFNEMQTGYFQTVMALANSIEAKDPYTRGHCQRVMEISCEIAKNLAMDENQIEELKYSAILHDIGKIGVPATILNKGEKLTEYEFNEIKKHPLIAYTILKDVEFIKNGLNGILQHHERNDGKGYPYGIKGEEICLFAKILCIADAFDAMTSDRPYRKGMTMERAIIEIERCKGTQFDEEIASVFIEMSKKIINM